MSSTTSYLQTQTHEPDPRFEGGPDIEASVGNGYSNESPNRRAKKFRLSISKRLHNTAILAFISFIILLISFASPYWLASYKFTDSAFKRLGLWDFCFHDYRHPSYQYDTKFNGCHWIYSPVYTNIRDWLQPPWFMFVQAVMTIALCVAALGLMSVSVIFMHFLVQYQLLILSVTLVCHAFTTMLVGFALITFYLKAFDRSWIMYPDFNHVDWAFFFALVAMVGNGVAAFYYRQEIRSLKNRMLKMKRLIVATNPRSRLGGDMDSLDAVYASRSINTYNQSSGQDGNGGAGQKDYGLVYPHFTQV